MKKYEQKSSSERGMIFIGTEIPLELRRRVKMECVRTRTSMKDFFKQAIEAKLK